jgi:hypothetical protein
VYGKTHIDPPACSVAVTSLLMLGILPALNFYEIDSIITPSIIVILSIAYAIYSHLQLEKAEK